MALALLIDVRSHCREKVGRSRLGQSGRELGLVSMLDWATYQALEQRLRAASGNEASRSVDQGRINANLHCHGLDLLKGQAGGGVSHDTGSLRQVRSLVQDESDLVVAVMPLAFANRRPRIRVAVRTRLRTIPLYARRGLWLQPAARSNGSAILLRG